MGVNAYKSLPKNFGSSTFSLAKKEILALHVQVLAPNPEFQYWYFVMINIHDNLPIYIFTCTNMSHEGLFPFYCPQFNNFSYLLILFITGNTILITLCYVPFCEGRNLMKSIGLRWKEIKATFYWLNYSFDTGAQEITVFNNFCEIYLILSLIVLAM